MTASGRCWQDHTNTRGVTQGEVFVGVILPSDILTEVPMSRLSLLEATDTGINLAGQFLGNYKGGGFNLVTSTGVPLTCRDLDNSDWGDITDD